MLIFLLASSLLVYKNETHFVLILHPVTLLNLLILTVLGWNLWGFLHRVLSFANGELYFFFYDLNSFLSSLNTFVPLTALTGCPVC